jgi:hypothetical protein
MPYFKNKDINLLFIHIPKTGGSSLEYYLSQKYKIPLDNDSLSGFLKNDNVEINNLKEKHQIKSSMQHFTYQNIVDLTNERIINIDFENNLKIMSIVRNPYTRIVSDLFSSYLIDINTSKEEVYHILSNNYIHSDKYDNHNLTQFSFLMDEKGKLLENITIFKTEILTDSLIKYGYKDFYVYINQRYISIDHFSYLNDDSIRLINDYYSKDFEYFNYEKIIV